MWTNNDASIIVYKFRPERTGFNMHAEDTRPQLTFFALHPWYSLFIHAYFLDNKFIFNPRIIIGCNYRLQYMNDLFEIKLQLSEFVWTLRSSF